MTNQYLSAFYDNPLIRGAVMQSSDSQDKSLSFLSLLSHHDSLTAHVAFE